MSTQRISIFKLAIISCVLLVVTWVAFRSFAGLNLFPQQNESMTADSLINVSENNVPVRDSIVNYGMELLNTPYAPSGSGIDGFDCSGFVYYVFKHFNIEVPRSSPQFEHFGKEVPIDKVQKGDVLVFLSPTSDAIGHIGIVTNPQGMQSEFIHSTSGRQMKVVISSLNAEGYKIRFLKAVSVLN